jgi:Holliday junction resolvase
MPNSTKKGKRGERELARKLRDEGYGAVRSEQVDGHLAPDLLTSMHEIVHIEVKRTGDTTLTHESTIDQWIATAEVQCPDEKHWAVGWRPDHGSWHFFIDPSYWTLQTTQGYVMDTPFALVRGVEGFVSALDPRMSYTVMDPDDWVPRQNEPIRQREQEASQL